MPTPRVRVTFFNRSYWPDTGATGQLLTELAEDLVQQHGLEVTVVTGPAVSSPDQRPRREIHNGVEIIRTAGTRFRPRRFAGRALNYLSYFAAATATALRLPEQDVVVALTDPPIIGLAALAARRRGGFIFLCQDVFPEVAALLDDFRSPVADRILERVNRLLIVRASRVIVLGETMADRLVERKGARRDRLAVIHNWADTTAIVPGPKQNPFSEEHGFADRFVVLHAGNIGMGQNLEAVLQAAALLVQRTDVIFLFIGDGTKRAELEEAARSRGLTNVRFLPFQPREALRWTYATADVCLVSLRPGLSGYIVPSKLYPILAAGRPVIAAVDDDSEVAAIASQYHCGIRVPPGDAAALAAVITTLADEPALRQRLGSHARTAAENYSRSRQVAKYASVITSVAATC
jgi:colanic acid biosynthesis glycosyl transferase WcaI